MHIPTTISILLLAASGPLTTASPLYKRTQLASSGAVRPTELISRALEVVGIQVRQDTDTSADCSLTGCTSSGAAAGENTTSSSSSSCQLLGGCSSGSSSACETEGNDVNDTSSSICGSSTSTDSDGSLDGPILGDDGLLRRRGTGSFDLMKRIEVVLAEWRAEEAPVSEVLEA